MQSLPQLAFVRGNGVWQFVGWYRDTTDEKNRLSANSSELNVAELTADPLFIGLWKYYEVPAGTSVADKPTAKLTTKDVSGNVVVRYADEQGRVIADEQVKDSKLVSKQTFVDGQLAKEDLTGESYDVDNAQDKPAEITFDGKKYVFVKLLEG